MNKTAQQKKKLTLEDFAITVEKNFQQIRENMATKEDLKRFATKDDLKAFATKEDLKRFATKDDISEFATRTDVRNIVSEAKDELMKEMGKFKYAKEIDQLNIRVTRIEKKLDVK